MKDHTRTRRLPSGARLLDAILAAAFLVLALSISGTSALSALAGQSQNLLPAQAVNIVDPATFGARGDGVADDTPAFQASLDDLNNKGGGVLQLQAGTYMLRKTASGGFLSIYPNITIAGQGRDVSVIKIAANQGTYDSVLAPSPAEADCSNFGLANLTIDQNQGENPVTPTIDSGNARAALIVFAGRGVSITGCRFTNADSINTLAVSGTAKNSVISDNLFENIGGDVEHDHSTIYTDGVNCLIEDNAFTATGRIGARTAIEVHGDFSRIVNNTISKYRQGGNITGITTNSTGSTNLIVEGNTVTGCQFGFLIWSYAPYGINTISVSDNTIECDAAAWLWGYPTVSGIYLQVPSSSPVKDLSIIGNTITIRNSASNGTGNDDSAGINWRRSNPAVADVNVTIMNNTITNSLAAGIRWSNNATNLQITGNTIINPASGTGSLAPSSLAGIRLNGSLTGASVTDNTIVRTSAASRMTTPIINKAAGSVTIANNH